MGKSFGMGILRWRGVIQIAPPEFCRKLYWYCIKATGIEWMTAQDAATTQQQTTRAAKAQQGLGAVARTAGVKPAAGAQHWAQPTLVSPDQAQEKSAHRGLKAYDEGVTKPVWNTSRGRFRTKFNANVYRCQLLRRRA